MPNESAGGTVYRKFTSRSFSTGVPTTLAGTPAISIYKDASTTQSTAGVTLTADFDSVTGLNHVSIDTSADGSFYVNGSHYDLVITTGTVGGVSVVGEAVGSFDLAVAALTAAQIATGIFQDTTASDFTVSNSFGKSVFTGNAPGAANGLALVGSDMGSVTVGGYSGGEDPATLILGAIQTNWQGDGTIGQSIGLAAGVLPLSPLSSFSFPMRLSTDGSLAPGKTVTATRITDGATPVACTNSPTEIGGGFYTIAFSDTDLSFTSDVTFIFAASGCLDTIFKSVAG